MVDPIASGAVIYGDDLDGAGPFPWLTNPEGQPQGQPLTPEQDGSNGFLTSTGPWWLDPNHHDPGAGYLNLLSFAYVKSLIGASGPEYSYNDATFSFDVNLDNLELPTGAHVYFWFQAYDYSLDRAVNYVLSSTPIETLASGGGWTHVTLTLSSDDADWTALGSNADRLALYGVSESVAHALASSVLDLGIFIFLGNDLQPDPASGSASFDNFSLQLDPDALRSFREFDVNYGTQRLNIALSLSDPDSSDFDGGSYTVAFEQGADSADKLSIISTGNIQQSGTDLYWGAQLIGTVAGGTGGSPLVVTFNASATLEAIEALGLAIGYSRTANQPAPDKEVSVTFADGDGGSTQVALFDLLISDQTQSAGDDVYVVNDLSPANWPLVDEGGYDTIDATALTQNATIVLENTLYYPANPKIIYTPAPTVVEKVLSGSGNDFLWGSYLTDYLDGGPGADNIYGRVGDDLLFGNDGADNIEGGEGADQIDGGAGFDTAYYTGAILGVIVDMLDNQRNTSDAQGDVLVSIEGLSGSDGNDSLYANDSANSLVGRAGQDLLVGRGGDDQIYGGDGDDTLIGNAGADLLDGGNGVDTASYVQAGAGVTADLTQPSQNSGEATGDTYFSIEALRGSAFNDVLAGDGANNRLEGGDGHDELFGRAGNDTLLGGAGADALYGGFGDDWYYVDNAGDTIDESTGAGNDRVLTSVSYTLAAGVEVEKLTTTDNEDITALQLTGNEFDQLIYGNAGNNVLRGGGGTDTLVGLGGDDWLYVDSAGDRISEQAGGGFDRVLASASYVLTAGAYVEKLTTADNLGTQAINLTGNELDQLIYGNAGNNVLRGGGGTDTLVGLEGDDWLYVDSAGDLVNESAGGGYDRVLASANYTLTAGAYVEIMTTADNLGTQAINLTGNELDQLIYGNAGNNVLRGGGGTDALIGFEGDDWFYVDSAGDTINESAGGGYDRVLTSVSYALAAGVYVEMMTTADNNGTQAINLTGNELTQVIFGNAGNNILNGGGGADQLCGLGGDDWYFVDNAADEINEKVGQGYDRVLTSTSYVLTAGAYVEMMTTTDNLGTSAINLTGNAFDQAIYGNFGNNVLIGGGGTDTLIGFGGDDWFYVDSAGDLINESATGGTDRVLASVSYVLNAGAYVESLTTTDNLGTQAINLTGNELDQSIYGNAGNNVLRGGGGTDTLVGLGGDDWLYVDSAGDVVTESAGGGYDRVLASVSYTLDAGSYVEKLTTADNFGTQAINLTGNELGQVIFGNAGNNILDGRGGTDSLVGLGGDDWFVFSSPLGPDNIDTISDFQHGADKVVLDDAVFTGLGLGALAANAFAIGSVAQDADTHILYNPANGLLRFDADGNGAGAAVIFAAVTPGLELTAADFLVI